MPSNEELPIEPNKVTLELLSRAKLFLDHALSHSSHDSSLDRMVAIHGMDNAIEFLLRIISSHLEYESIENKRLPGSLTEMAGALNKFLSKKFNYRLTYLDDIKLLRKVRNLVQHGATDPAPDMERFVSFTKRFFNKTIENIFGLSPENLRISQLIDEEDIKAHLEKAERLLEQGKYLESIVSSRDAFENAIFQKKVEDRINVDPSPILAKPGSNSSVFSQYFFRELTNLLQVNSFDINYTKFERYREIIDHIPGKYKVESWSSVMQRPWNKEDANFIYGFVSQYVYKWQIEELDPLYERDSFHNKFTIIESLGGIELKETAPSFIYTEEEQDIRIHYVSEKTKNDLESLKENSIYRFNSIHYKDGQKDLDLNFDVKLLKILFNLETNNPVRWEVIINFEKVPLSWHRKDFENGKLVKESPSLNTSDLNKLIELDHIGEVTAQKIIFFREENSGINNPKDLDEIDNLTKKQKEEILKYSRI